MMPPWQDAISALAPIIGGAGLSGIVIAVLGFFVSSRRGGRPAGEVPPVAGVIVSTDDVRMIALSLNRLADTLERVLRATHEVTDMVRAVTGELRSAREEMERMRREE